MLAPLNLGVDHVRWVPQHKQRLLLAAKSIPLVFYGGAAGGGKSDGLLGDFAQEVGKGYGAKWKGVFIRQSIPELEEAIERARMLFEPIGAIWKEQKKRLIFPDKEVLQFKSVKDAKTFKRVQGFQFPWIGVDECGNYESLEPLLMLLTRMRSGRGKVPFPRMRLSGNPGGLNHSNLKDFFVDPHPEGLRIIRDNRSKIPRVYIPSSLDDNPAMLEDNPLYESFLESSGNATYVKMIRYGIWDVMTGAYFDNFREHLHVKPRFHIPSHWTRIGGFDWGFKSPWAMLKAAVSDGSVEGIPEGAIVVYDEYYGLKDKQINVGTKEPAETVAEKLAPLCAELGEIYFDTSIIEQQNQMFEVGVTYGEIFQNQGLPVLKADKKRVTGWNEVYQRLNDGMLFFFDSCYHTIRTLPMLLHCEKRIDDLDTRGEDHLADALRYLCMSRPYVTRKLEVMEQKYHGIYVGEESDLTYRDFKGEEFYDYDEVY